MRRGGGAGSKAILKGTLGNQQRLEAEDDMTRQVGNEPAVIEKVEGFRRLALGDFKVTQIPYTLSLLSSFSSTRERNTIHAWTLI